MSVKIAMQKTGIGALFGVFLLSVAMSDSAFATIIRSGTVLSSTPSACCNLVAERLLDQSGLSVGYTNGVTDFDSYLALNPTATGTSTEPNFPAGYFAGAGAIVDIDLGETLTLTRLAMWNDHDFQGVNAFHLLIADNSSFAGAVALGSFNALFGNNDNVQLDYAIGAPYQVFDLNDATGRYVRVEFDTAHLDVFINVGELAFGIDAESVPEPATLALFGVGLAGLRLARRRKAA
jgi:hypothetical protein